ncbi:MAG: hypothetical protein R3C14_29170 [Caldilineaceae bacterium]
MTPITLTVREAENEQLRALVQRTQVTHRPIMLTTEDTLEPMVVLLESSVYEELQRKERQFFQIQLRQLDQQLDGAEKQWVDSNARRRFVDAFPTGTHALWKLCPADAQDLCVTLDMAAHRLSMESVTIEQLAALRHCLRLLQDGAPTETAIESCERQLLASGLSTLMSGSESLVQLYMDEL